MEPKEFITPRQPHAKRAVDGGSRVRPRLGSPCALLRSMPSCHPYACGHPGDVAEWLRSGLQSRLHRFDSGRRLYANCLQNGTFRASWRCSRDAQNGLLSQNSPGTGVLAGKKKGASHAARPHCFTLA